MRYRIHKASSYRYKESTGFIKLQDTDTKRDTGFRKIRVTDKKKAPDSRNSKYK
jgi:hypothetical protein